MSAVTTKAPQAEVYEFNPIAPCKVEWFQKELDLACRDKGEVALRIVWGPYLETFKGEINGVPVIRKKYPHPAFQMKQSARGYFIVRGGEKVGYKTLQGIITGDPNGLLVPDMYLEQRGLERWIIEQKIRDDVARKQHAENRYVNHNGLIKDALGEFPKDGLWVWFHQLEKHDSPKHQDTGFCTRCACCKHFDEQNMMCQGGYRDPDHRDLAFIRESIYESMKTPMLRNPADPPTAQEIQRETLKERDRVVMAQQKIDDNTELEIQEEIATILAAKLEPKFDFGEAYQRQSANRKLVITSR